MMQKIAFAFTRSFAIHDYRNAFQFDILSDSNARGDAEQMAMQKKMAANDKRQSDLRQALNRIVTNRPLWHFAAIGRTAIAVRVP